jgi:hypothetical protein
VIACCVARIEGAHLLCLLSSDGNRLPLTRRNGEGSGNWAQFKLSGPTQQGVEQLLLVDTGSDPADLIITTSLAATLGLGTPERRERRITGASGRPLNLVDYPTMVRKTRPEFVKNALDFVRFSFWRFRTFSSRRLA